MPHSHDRRFFGVVILSGKRFLEVFHSRFPTFADRDSEHDLVQC